MDEREPPPAPIRLQADDHDDDFHVPRGAWMLIAAVVIAQAALFAAVFAYDHSALAGGFAIIAVWPWVLAICLLAAGPILFAVRLRRVRRRRAALERGEWLVEETSGKR